MRTELGGDLFLFYLDYLYDFDLKKNNLSCLVLPYQNTGSLLVFPDLQHLEMNTWELKALMVV